MDKNNPHREMILALLDGKPIQTIDNEDRWLDVVDPKFEVGSTYRIRPKNKPVDMSKFIGSTVVCMFRDNINEQWEYALLQRVVRDEYLYRTETLGFKQCEPMEDYWIANAGCSGCPVPEGLSYTVTCRNGDFIAFNDRGGLINPHWYLTTINPYDVMQYKITGLQAGWDYPWNIK
jgi:hypothetical protein